MWKTQNPPEKSGFKIAKDGFSQHKSKYAWNQRELIKTQESLIVREGRSKSIKNWHFIKWGSSGGDLLGLWGYENNDKGDSGIIAQSRYGDEKARFSSSVSRLPVEINGFCIQCVLNTSMLGESDVREKIRSSLIHVKMCQIYAIFIVCNNIR